MHQSPDDIFAAHFWSWPDPALKRDAHGRVLFVNAAFLQLFGGRVEDWRGQAVQGWHAPQPGPTPARFEIRTPATPHLPEQVYDWMELCGADGSAFALARNVTAFAASQTPPNPPAEMDPAAHAAQNQNAVQAASVPHSAPSDTQAPVDAAPAFEAAPAAPAVDAPQTAPQTAPLAAAPDEPVQPAPEPVFEMPALDVPDIDVPPLDVPQITAQPARASAPEAAAPVPAAAPQAEAAPVAESAPKPAPKPAPERAFERRALPIENDEAVLGSNWRDAVIAKAIGAVDAPAASDAAPAAPKSGSAEANGPIRILLAEDNAINALLTRTLLEAEGHTVETVEDGQLAVEAMKTSNFDMIFMDMRMPNMDGLEATRKIRALANVPSDLPIVALTANAFDDDRNACFDSGMNDFMTKPVSAEELSEMVGRWAGVQEQALAS